MMRSLIGAALALAFAIPHAEALGRPHKAAHRHAPSGLSIGKTALPGRAGASSGHKLGAVLPTGNCNPNFVQGQIPPASTWNAAFNCAFPQAGGSLSGPLGLPASTTASAPLNIAAGTSPTSPSNGDVWYASGVGLMTQQEGATIGPLGAGGGGGGSASFTASGNYVNVPSVTTSANQSLSAFAGPNALLKNYGTTEIIFHASPSATSVTVATADGIIEPGATQEIALGTNVNIAVASVVNGSISGTGAVQIIDGTGLWTGTGSNALPPGAAISALQPALNGDGGALAHVTNLPATQAVSGTFWQATQPVSLVSLPLPTGAAAPFTASGGYAALAAGAASARVAVPSNSGSISIENQTSNAACVLFGNSSVTATSGSSLCTNDNTIPGNAIVYLAPPSGAVDIAAIAQSSSNVTNLVLSGGSGGGGGFSSGGSGGSGGSGCGSTSITPCYGTPTNSTSTNVTLSGSNTVSVVGNVGTTASAPIAITSGNTPTTVLIKAGSSGLLTYLSSWDVVANSGATWQWEEGTTTTNPCDTGTIVLTGSYPMTGQQVGLTGAATAALVTQVTGDNLCAVVTTLTAYNGHYQWNQH